ncbi:Holliday junction resolvase RuvX [Lactococcus insecticola]|uniref:Putative pre-16S rRNA nuclease n=1 Tax=Pseudolactococcus insecticola TaxID=2709158 RepID=A0A6A0B7R6_9LACT|nr:Holliday junction resolvase RuvX [Lactococcus insecticola]GFH40394.1 putative pre-16S rRNA nuclease [Lactococcus insecticola]
MSFQRLIGLDVGSVTVGVAVSDLLGYTAQPVETIRINEASQDYGFERLTELVAEYQPARFVLGLPKHMNNDEGVRAKASRHYGDLLEKRFGIPVSYQDERLTSAQAEKVLIAGHTRRENRKKYIDKLAAVLILQNYLDSHSL